MLSRVICLVLVAVAVATPLGFTNDDDMVGLKKIPICWSTPTRCETNSHCAGSCSVCYSHKPGKAMSGLCGVHPTQIPEDDAAPQQIHIAQGRNPHSMTVSWITDIAAPAIASFRKKNAESHWQAVVGRTLNYTSNCHGDRTPDYFYQSGYIHHVEFVGLDANAEYFYRVGDMTNPDGVSDVFTFPTLPAVGQLPEPLSFTIIGDLGQTADSQATVAHILSDTSMKALLHAGDMSYADCDQKRWDSWGKMVQPLAATRAYMVAAGNHEIEFDPVAQDTFAAYKARFAMPEIQPTKDVTTVKELPNYCTPSDYSGHFQYGNSYYSFEFSTVHVIVLNSYTVADPGTDQYEWLQADLRAVDRNITPWVIVMTHGPWYNSNHDHHNEKMTLAMKASLESVLYEHKVNLVFAGHVHAYERSYPTYQNETFAAGGAPVYINTGDAGNREGHAGPYLEPTPNWSAVRNNLNYGHSKVTVFNSTHAYFEWRSNEEEVIEVIDDTWILNDLSQWGVRATY